jgi:hypothetical protein
VVPQLRAVVKVLETRHRETKSTHTRCHAGPRIYAGPLLSDTHDGGDAGTGFLTGGPEANRPLGRIGRLLEVDIKMGLRINKMGKCGLD